MGCFGKVSGWFISRRIMPKICGDLLCFRMDACYKASFKEQSGVETDLSYNYVTSDFRATEK